MATNNAPRGLVMARQNGSGSNSTGINTIDWSAAVTVPSAALPTSMFTGDPLYALVSSSVLPSPANVTNKTIGVFQGCSFVNSDGEQKFSRHWTGGTTATDIKLFISNNPEQTYFIQASATVSSGYLFSGNGKPINCSWATGTGSTKTGQSAYVITPASCTDAMSNVRIIRRAPWDTGGEGTANTDAYPWYEVKLNMIHDNFVTTSIA
jgi:hypothetical protein